VRQAAALVATVVGQDLEQTEDGRFRIARRVAPDRVISTVDPEARHGHKTQARGFDGYKGHIAIDPDSEIITMAGVTAANVGDGSVAKDLLQDVIPVAAERADAAASTEQTSTAGLREPAGAVPEAASPEGVVAASEPVEVYGDASYGSAEVLTHLEQGGAVPNVKVQSAAAPDGHFTKDAFRIDLDNDTVTCPAGRLVQIRRREDGSGVASFGPACKACPMASSCTDAKAGRDIRLHKDERLLLEGRKRQQCPKWRASYKATRPKVERKIAHLMRRRHGGRRARMRGTERVGQDFILLCAAANLQRLATLELRSVTAPAAAAEAV
jgi:hypothetical protein